MLRLVPGGPAFRRTVMLSAMALSLLSGREQSVFAAYLPDSRARALIHRRRNYRPTRPPERPRCPHGDGSQP